MAQITRSTLKARLKKFFPNGNDKFRLQVAEWIFDRYADLDDKVSSGMIELYVDSYRTGKMIVEDEVPLALQSRRVAGGFSECPGETWWAA
jgi:hypothetical protein